jgi:hypothetical protein
MRPVFLLALALNLPACNPAPPIETQAVAPAWGVDWVGTVFSRTENPSELPALEQAFPTVRFTVYDHLYHPDKARAAKVPSNGYVAIQRRNTAGNAVGRPTLLPLNASPEQQKEILSQLSQPLRRAHWISDTLSAGPKAEPKASGKRLLESLAAHNVVVESASDTVQSSTPDLLLILSPTQDLTPKQDTAIRAHLARGGPILVALEPESPGFGDTRLAELLQDLGVDMQPGLVASETNQVWERLGTPSPGDQYNHAASRFLPHGAIPSLSNPQFQSLSVVFSRAALVQPRRTGSAKAVPIVLSHQSAWAEVDQNGVQSGKERQGSLPLVLASEGGPGRPGRAIIYADTTALSDRWALHPGNKILLKDSLNWLLPQKDPPDPTRPAPFSEAIQPVQIFPHQGPLQEIQLIQPERTLRIQQRRDLFGDFIWVDRESTTETGLSYKGNVLSESIWPRFAPLNALRIWDHTTSERLSALGFQSPAPILRLIEKGGNSRDLHLGGKPYKGTGRYAWDPITNRAMLLNTDDLLALLGPPERLEDLRVLPAISWDRVEIPGAVYPLRIEQKGEKWALTGTGTATTPAQFLAASQLAGALQSLGVMGAADLGPSQESPPPALTVRFFPSKAGQAVEVQLAQHQGQWIAASDHSRIWVQVPQKAAQAILQNAQALQDL